MAEVAHHGETKSPELYRITYDGSINDEPDFVVMGGTTEPISEKLNDPYTENASLSAAAKVWDRRVEASRRQRRAACSRRGDAGGGDPGRQPAPPRVPAHHRLSARSDAVRGGLSSDESEPDA